MTNSNEHEGLRLKDAGMTLAIEAEFRDDRWWRLYALRALRGLCEEQEYLDSDDLHRKMTKPNHANAWGSVWKKAIERGWIIETIDQPRRRSIRPEAHGAKMTRYESLIWKGFQ